MGTKKGQVIHLQTEVNTEEEWLTLLQNEGLTVADIYAGWAGPCAGMIGNLKKVKVDYGGDLLRLAIVNSDNIKELARFKNKCEPTWMFIVAGQLSDLMFGANAPRLQRLIIAELEKETKAAAGTGTRTTHPFEELTDEEQIRFQAAEKIRLAILAEKVAKEAAANAEQARRTMEHLVVMLPAYTVLLIMPFLYEIDGAWSQIIEKFVDMDLVTIDDQQIEMEPEQFAELVYAGTEELTEECKEALAAGPVTLKIITSKPPEPDYWAEEAEQEEEVATPFTEPEPVTDLLIAVYTLIYGTPPPSQGPPRPEPGSFVDKFSPSVDIPALWTPQTAFAKARCIMQFFPAFADKYAETPEPPPIPRLAMMFETSRAKEVFEMVKEFGDEILNIGFFSNENPQTASRIAKTLEDYEKRHFHITGDERIVLAISRVRSDPLLTLSTIQPCYISSDVEDGFKECEAFFPDDADDFPSALPSDITLYSDVPQPEEVSIYEYERAVSVKDEFAEDEDETLSMLFGPVPDAPPPVVEAAPVDEAPPPSSPPIDD